MPRTEVMVPGILVALKTSVRGGVEYVRSDIEREEEGHVKKWHTTRYMDDPEERKAASELVNKSSHQVARLCVRTTFGLLCRTDKEAELDEAIRSVRAEIKAFNAEAEHCTVHVNAVKGRIADNDEEAIRALIDEATEIMDAMDSKLAEGIAAVDPDKAIKAVRAAATKAKDLSAMLTPEAAAKIEEALEAARSGARTIVKKTKDLDAQIATRMVEIERDKIRTARFSFLEAAEASVESLPSVDLGRGASLELGPDSGPVSGLAVAREEVTV